MTSVPRVPFESMTPALQERLGPRVERLGYLGEFFQASAVQPEVLDAFCAFTDTTRDALGTELAEVVAITVSVAAGNRYELNQHQQLCRKLGYDDGWIAAVQACDPTLDASIHDVQMLVLAILADDGNGLHAADAMAAVVSTLGAETAVAVVFATGRYVTHALMCNVLALDPPVGSIFDEPDAAR